MTPFSDLPESNSLERIFSLASFQLERVIHLAIDFQKCYINGKKQTGIAQHLGQNIAPAFNKLGIQTCWVYLADSNLSEADPNRQLIHVSPASDDKFLRKLAFSSFAGKVFVHDGHNQKNEQETTLHGYLQQQGKDTLLVSGFKFPRCVHTTVMDALKPEYSYNVALLEDCTNFYPNKFIHEYGSKRPMIKKGAVFAKANDVINHLKLFSCEA